MVLYQKLAPKFAYISFVTVPGAECGLKAFPQKTPHYGRFKFSGDNLLTYTRTTASAPPNAEKTAETKAVANNHQEAVAAALRVSSACRCA